VECTRNISATSATVSTFLVSDSLIKVRFIRSSTLASG
jgi:hypothetical protein